MARLWLTRTSGAAALVDPDCGGTVHRLRLVDTKKDPEAIDLLAGDPDPDASVPSSPGMFRGRLLVPFNDRIRGGRYIWQGESYQLPLNDPEQGDAIHGFLYRSALTPDPMLAGDRLTLSGELPGVTGYPAPLLVNARYHLEDSAFYLEVRISNRGTRSAPLAAGWHPYFVLPGSSLATWMLHLPAHRFHAVDGSLIPTGATPPVAGTEFDFRRPRSVGDQELDMAWPLDAPWNDPVTLSDGTRCIRLRMGGILDTVQVFSPPDRRSLAIEPVTGPADSFNRVNQVLELLPGTSASARLRVELVRLP